MTPQVTVVLPAHNAAATLDRAIASLLVQQADWEVIVVDDGSTDATAHLARLHAAEDPRVEVVCRRQGGPAAARNTALARAAGRWVLFLDADDELAPAGLESLLGAAEAAPAARWLCGGWVRITSDGGSNPYPARRLDDAPAVLARTCPFAIHACLTERELILEAGGFDETLRTCEDWDLWQRIGRTEGSPVPVDAIVACYRVRSASQSFDTARLLADGLLVIDRGHRPPVAPGGLRGAQVAFAAYVAGLHLGAGTAPPDIAGALGDEPAPEVEPAAIASMLCTAVPLGAMTVPGRWADIADSTSGGLVMLLDGLERLTGAPLLARRTLRHLSRLVALAAEPGPPFQVGGERIVDLDLGAPVDARVNTDGAQRLQVRAVLDGELLGTAEIASYAEDDVPGAIALDAVLERASWPWLERTVLEPLLDELTIDRGGTVRRAGIAVGRVHSDNPTRSELMDRTGWTLFLQELWGAPDTNDEGFYADVPSPAESSPDAGHDLLIEVSAPLPKDRLRRGPCTVQVTVGGFPLDRFALARENAPLGPARLRSAICRRGGLELAHLAMRGALTVQARGDETLRSRLLRAAGRLTAAPAPPPSADGAVLGVGWQAVVDPFLARRERLTVLGRVPGRAPTAGSGRMNLLPRGAGGMLIASAVSEGRPIARIGYEGEDSRDEAVLCAPGVAWARLDPLATARSISGALPERALQRRTARSAASFEARFAVAEDPWGYTSNYEQRKFEQTLYLLPSQLGSLMEVGCAEGHFTVQAAPRVQRLVGCDISLLALERARQRCADLANVSFRRQDIFTEPIAERWDAIVCSEVLYYAGNRAELHRAARSIADALVPGAILVTAHANLVIDAPSKPGFDWDQSFGALGIQRELRRTGLLALEAEIATPMYRVQRWRRHRYRRGSLRRRLPARIDRRNAEAAADVPTHVRASFLPDGGLPRRLTSPAEERLPILMYHRIAPTGNAAGRRWRVTPDELDEQLAFLQSAGFSTITPADWRDAVSLGRPLPADPLLLTFDDAYADFAEHAAPLLIRRGMTATIFVVSALAGSTNIWDGDRDRAPLLDWSELRALRDDGFSIGAHTRSHPPLAGLPDTSALDELTGCRLDVLKQLGQPPVALAYPYGDVADGVRRLAAAAGYDIAFGCTPGRASRGSDLLDLPRVEMHGGMSLADVARQATSW